MLVNSGNGRTSEAQEWDVLWKRKLGFFCSKLPIHVFSGWHFKQKEVFKLKTVWPSLWPQNALNDHRGSHTSLTQLSLFWTLFSFIWRSSAQDFLVALVTFGSACFCFCGRIQTHRATHILQLQQLVLLSFVFVVQWWLTDSLHFNGTFQL